MGVMDTSATGDTRALLQSERVRTRNLQILERRARFEASHPGIDIKAKREPGGPLTFYVRADDVQVCWLNASAMMDDLEKAVRQDLYPESNA